MSWIHRFVLALVLVWARIINVHYYDVLNVFYAFYLVTDSHWCILTYHTKKVSFYWNFAFLRHVLPHKDICDLTYACKNITTHFMSMPYFVATLFFIGTTPNYFILE